MQAFSANDDATNWHAPGDEQPSTTNPVNNDPVCTCHEHTHEHENIDILHSDANAKNTSVTGAPSLQAPVTPSFDFWVTPLILPPPAEHPVAHTLDAAPRPAFNYDSIDVFKTVICALSVEGTEEQSFEEYEAMYEQNLMSPDLLTGVQYKHKAVRPEHDFDLNSVSEHNGDPVMGTVHLSLGRGGLDPPGRASKGGSGVFCTLYLGA